MPFLPFQYNRSRVEQKTGLPCRHLAKGLYGLNEEEQLSGHRARLTKWMKRYGGRKAGNQRESKLKEQTKKSAADDDADDNEVRKKSKQ